MTATQGLLFAVWFALCAVSGGGLLVLNAKYVMQRDTQSAWMLAPGLFAAFLVWNGTELGELSIFAGFSAVAQTAGGIFGVLNLAHHARKGLTPRGGSAS